MKRQFDKKPTKPRNRKPVLVIIGEGYNVTEIQYFLHFNKQNGKYSIQSHRAGHVTDPVGLVKDAEKYWEDNQLVNIKKKKFNPKDLAGKSVTHKSREKRLADEKYYKKKKMKRPGKVKSLANLLLN